MTAQMDWDFLKTLALLVSVALNIWLSGMLAKAIGQLRELDEDAADDANRTGGA